MRVTFPKLDTEYTLYVGANGIWTMHVWVGGHWTATFDNVSNFGDPFASRVQYDGWR